MQFESYRFCWKFRSETGIKLGFLRCVGEGKNEVGIKVTMQYAALYYTICALPLRFCAARICTVCMEEEEMNPNEC